MVARTLLRSTARIGRSLFLGTLLAVAFSTGVPSQASPVVETSVRPVASSVLPADRLVGVAVTAPSPTEQVDTSPVPEITIRRGTDTQRQRLELALRRFAAAGLLLPDLEIVFGGTEEPCQGHRGLFETSHTPWRISICAELDFVYEHELAHAWEAAMMTDEQRAAFMSRAGLTVWSSHDSHPTERGVEGVAFVIQQGLGGSPLSASLSAGRLDSLGSFEMLTGRPDPRLAVWERRARNVPVSLSDRGEIHDAVGGAA